MHQKAQGENYIPVSAALGLDQWFHDVGLVRRERKRETLRVWMARTQSKNQHQKVG